MSSVTQQESFSSNSFSTWVPPENWEKYQQQCTELQEVAETEEKAKSQQATLVKTLEGKIVTKQKSGFAKFCEIFTKFHHKRHAAKVHVQKELYHELEKQRDALHENIKTEITFIVNRIDQEIEDVQLTSLHVESLQKLFFEEFNKLPEDLFVPFLAKLIKKDSKLEHILTVGAQEKYKKMSPALLEALKATKNQNNPNTN
jgi:hypothetical protein